ncbi:hypothetical protein RclHR1_01230007 [Rhizophagus clarus]|uniref:Uncharacterized protein n=1 Tax=Rhizophagus clarus TaxID=94130 RepID=A0A2Z6QLV7_9GLOM|nr:hypothetical protein RclHR1_01230007 [Rhizophagus clarus]
MNIEERKKKKKQIDGMGSMFEEGNEKDDISNSFNELADCHFPLFITYDKFFKMLQEMYGIKNVIKQRKLDAADIDTYDKKEKLYQSHLSLKHRILKITRSLKKDIGLVLIGSNPKVDFLTREDYSNISIKYPVFSYDWDKIYDLFEKYEIEKARNGHYGSIDQYNVGNFMSCQKKALDGPHIHEVYIDECQDKVFDHDSHALMYKWERTRAKINYSNIIINPSRFELDINYRSHNGILQLASSVIDLIRHFFPNSIDHLSCERGKIDGDENSFMMLTMSLLCVTIKLKIS